MEGRRACTSINFLSYAQFKVLKTDSVEYEIIFKVFYLPTDAQGFFAWYTLKML
jgi:hypothetical protein